MLINNIIMDGLTYKMKGFESQINTFDEYYTIIKKVKWTVTCVCSNYLVSIYVIIVYSF